VKTTVGTKVSYWISAVALDLRTNQLGDWSGIWRRNNGVVNWISKVRAIERLQNSIAIIALKEGVTKSTAFL
jgi:hypothetical protein